MEKRKILIVSPSLKMGGVEKETCNVANILNEMGFDVTFLAIFNQTKFFKLNPAVKFIEPSEKTNNLKFLKTIKFIRRHVKKYKPDTIFVYHNIYSAITLLALLDFNIPVFVRDVGSPLYKWPWKQKLFFRIIFKVLPPKGVLAQTNIGAELQQKWFPANTLFKVVHNPLYPMKMCENIKKKKYILAVGRFNDPLKGFDRLIEAYSMISPNEWKLVFAGDDENGLELKEQAKELGVFDRILFLGKVNNMSRVYTEASIFVIPSRSEGLPNALIEAMSFGLPCISFDFISGPRDLIENETNGIIVEDGNIPALAQAINELVHNEDKRIYLGLNAAKINQQLDPHKIGKEITEFILPVNKNRNSQH